MPKVGMQPIRRRQLIEATLASIHEHGLTDTTVSRIGAAAGLSPGIIHHYFGGKDDLLFEALRQLLGELRREIVDRLASATGVRRVHAIIDANFASSQFAPKAVTAWLAFWAEAPHSPRLARLQRIHSRRLLSNLVHALQQTIPRAEARMTALGLAAMIDGLWLQCALARGHLTPETARQVCCDYIDRHIGQRRTIS